MTAPTFPLAPHGTRARYVSGCRCDDCRAANRLLYHALQARGRALAAEIDPSTDGTCPGVLGEPCERRAKLRRDSLNVCARCRGKLAGNPLVPAKRAREHLRKLSRMGIGCRQAADAAVVAPSIVSRIVRGTKTRIRRSTERAILSVDEGARADRALIDAAPTWRLIRELEPEYLTRTALARALGYRGPALQLGRKRVTVRNAERVRRLHERVFGREVAA